MRYLILGLASSGLATARYLLNQKHTVFGMDDFDGVWNDPNVANLIKKGLKKTKIISEVDLVILSSGIHPKSPLLQKINQKKIPTVSEAAFSLGKMQTKCIAVTGTNGKTTTVHLLAHILNHCGFNVKMGGNVGKPLIHFLDEKLDYLICEMSSYQLMRQTTKAFVYGSLLNLTPDHLDWHGDFFSYAKAKAHLQELTDYFFVDFETYQSCPKLFVQKPKLVGLDSSSDVTLIGRTLFFYGKKSATLPKNHPFYAFEMQNVLHALAIVFSIGVKPQKAMDAVANFKRLEHRLEKVATIDGVDYINDSKATNIASFLRSIHSFKNKKIILIAGGQGKNQDFLHLSHKIKANIKQIYLIGEAKEKMKDALSHFSCSLEEDLESACKKAHQNASPKEVVLLAPMCSSFDQFENYIDRGNTFKYYVNEIKKKRKTRWQKSILS